MSPLVIKEGGLTFSLCPGGWHRLELVDALLEPGVDCLLKAIDEAYITKSGGSSMDLELLDELLY